LEPVNQTLEFTRICSRLAEHALSPMGAQLSLGLVPFSDLGQLKESLKRTAELQSLLDAEGSIPLQPFADLSEALRRAELEGSMMRSGELLDLYRILAMTRHLVKYFSDRIEAVPQLSGFLSGLKPLKPLESEIVRCLDPESGEMKDNASAELARIRARINRARESVRRKIESLLRQLAPQGVLQENVVVQRNGRLVLMVKEEQKRRVKGLVHDRSASGSSLFIEPLSTFEDNNLVQELVLEADREIERILRDLTARVRDSLHVIRRNIDLLIQLDLTHAKARLAQSLNAHAPELSESAQLSIFDGRHPILLLRMGESSVVPMSVELGEKERTLVISGPNAGGKTVALKTIGLLSLMALCGMPIPAQPHSKIGFFKRIFASIGDLQSIEQDLSTFSSHLEDLHHIDCYADQDSLVLVDEIGSGTDPEEGSALAMAILERLTQRRAITVVTTHQGPLKAFAHRTDFVCNGSLEFDPASLRSTFRFRIGTPGSSYAFEIADRLGLNCDLIERARQRVGAQKEKLESLIIELETKSVRYDKLLQELNLKETELRGLAKLYRERADDLKRHEHRMKKNAVREAEQIIKDANAAVERAVKEIRESRADRQTIRRAKTGLDKARDSLPELESGAAAPAGDVFEIEVGDVVRWEKTGRTGVVLTLADKKGRISVAVQGVRALVPAAELRKVEQPESLRSAVHLEVSPSTGSADEIDLRGMRIEQAIDEVERFLDRAILDGLHQVRLIHGKGTGALRRHINDYLKEHPQVERSRAGAWNEGDSGVTIVEMKER